MKYKLKFKTKAADVNLADKLLLIYDYFKSKNKYYISHVEGEMFFIDWFNSEGRSFRISLNTKKNTVSQNVYSASDTNFDFGVPFTNEELKLFDSYGFDLTIQHTKDTGQKITDWFWRKDLIKAEDSVEITEELFYKHFDSLGYKPEKSGQSDGGKSVWIVSKLIKNERVEIQFYSGEEWEEPVCVMASIGGPLCKVPTDALRLIDGLGLNLCPSQISATKQRVDDWFWKDKIKAGDVGVKNTLKENLLKLGYTEEFKRPQQVWYTKPDITNRYELFMVVNYRDNLIIKGFFQFDVGFHEYELKEYAFFTKTELRLIDGLGFKPTERSSEETGQYVDDWFHKAMDKRDASALVDSEDFKEYVKMIDDFMISQGYTLGNHMFKDSKTGDPTTEHKHLYYAKDGYHFMVWISAKLIDKYHKSDSTPHSSDIQYTKDELRFFDSLGYDIADFSIHKTKSKQNINDWFHKGLDELTKQEISERILEFYKQKDSTSKIIQDDELSDFSRFIKIEAKNFFINCFFDELYEVSKSGTIKNSKSNFDYMPFTQDELRFFDSLGFTVTPGHNAITSQKIDDWFHKGLDGLDLEAYRDVNGSEFKKLTDFFDKFMIQEGYTFKAHTGETSLRYYEKKAEDIRFLIWMSAKAIYKSKEGTTINSPFTMNELKFFDSLGYHIADQQAKHTGEKITDWFHKGLDEKIVCKKQIEAFMLEQDYKGVGSITGSNYLVYEKPKYKDEDFPRSQLTISLIDEVVEKLHHEMDRTGPFKYRANYEKLNSVESRFFDSLGFKIGKDQLEVTKENISDWFWNLKKAEDSISEALEEKIISFMSLQGYKRYQLQLVDRLHFRYNINNLTFSAVKVRLRTQTIEKSIIYRGIETPYAFNNDELKFFDSIGFDIAIYASSVTDQKIDDWFHKARDGKSLPDILTDELTNMGYMDMSESDDLLDFFNPVDYKNDPHTGTRLYIDTKSNEVEKLYEEYNPDRDDISSDYVPFNQEELRLLDSLGLKMCPLQKQLGPSQEMSDWFWKSKAHDASNPMQTVENYYTLKYGERVEKITHSLDIVEIRIDEKNPDLEFYTSVFIFGKKEIMHAIYNKKKDEFSEYIKFSSEELRLFDGLGFELEGYYAGRIDQKITDWFWGAKK